MLPCRLQAVLLALLPALPLAAQPAPLPAPAPLAETFAESIDVDVVSVEVFVTDRSGKPVAGLGRGDFELRVDGRPTPIANFYAAGGDAAPAAEEAPAAAARATSAPDDRRLTLLVFVDNASLRPAARLQVMEPLERFFRAGLGGGDRVLFASYDGVAVKIRRPPPGDAEAAVAALRDAVSPTARGSHTAAEEEHALEDLARAVTGAEVAEAMGRLETIDQQVRAASRGLVRILQELAGSAAGLPGRKALLYLSGDLRFDTGDPRVKDLAARADASRVTLYALGALPDPAAANDPKGMVQRLLLDRQADLARTFYEMTGPTGGLAGVGLHPGEVLAHVRDDFGSYYSLGFVPEKPHDGKTHRLKVRLPGKRGLEVRFAGYYTSRPRDERLAERAFREPPRRAVRHRARPPGGRRPSGGHPAGRSAGRGAHPDRGARRPRGPADPPRGGERCGGQAAAGAPRERPRPHPRWPLPAPPRRADRLPHHLRAAGGSGDRRGGAARRPLRP
jgi:VWFA-related protein